MTRKELFEKWAAALRCGFYKQGTGSLKRSGEFCCLGVLCDVGMRNGLSVNPSDWSGFGDEATSYWIELAIGGGSLMRYLAEKNDSGVSFKRIAAIVLSRLDDKTLSKEEIIR